MTSLLEDIHEQVEERSKSKTANAQILNELNMLLSQSSVVGSPIVWSLLDHVCEWISRYINKFGKLFHFIFVIHEKIMFVIVPLLFIITDFSYIYTVLLVSKGGMFLSCYFLATRPS
jgi:hypothetical protein